MTDHRDQREDLYEAQQAGVRVIKRGMKPEDKVYRGTCRHCSTEVEFKRSAARFHDDQRDGALLQVTCPVCRQQITVGV